MESSIGSCGLTRAPSKAATARGGAGTVRIVQFEVLNTSLVAEGANAEFEAFWSLFEQRPDRQALNWTLRVRLKRVVELDFVELEQLGVGQADYRSRDYSRTQEIADGLNYLGCDGLIVPSARYDCKNLIVYIQNLEKDCFVEEDESRVFRWPE